MTIPLSLPVAFTIMLIAVAEGPTGFKHSTLVIVMVTVSAASVVFWGKGRGGGETARPLTKRHNTRLFTVVGLGGVILQSYFSPG